MQQKYSKWNLLTLEASEAGDDVSGAPGCAGEAGLMTEERDTCERQEWQTEADTLPVGLMSHHADIFKTHKCVCVCVWYFCRVKKSHHTKMAQDTNTFTWIIIPKWK